MARATRRLYACDVPAPDWALPGGMTDEETLEAEEARDKIIVTEFRGSFTKNIRNITLPSKHITV